MEALLLGMFITSRQDAAKAERHRELERISQQKFQAEVLERLDTVRMQSLV